MTLRQCRHCDNLFNATSKYQKICFPCREYVMANRFRDRKVVLKELKEKNSIELKGGKNQDGNKD